MGVFSKDNDYYQDFYSNVPLTPEQIKQREKNSKEIIREMEKTFKFVVPRLLENLK